jgi:FixJ family two-component response regulator
MPGFGQFSAGSSMDTMCSPRTAPFRGVSARVARKPLVAVVDDDRAVVNSLEFALGTEGYRVAPFLTGQSFIDRAHPGIDCLVVDFRLPGMDGIQLLEELRHRGRVPPHILIASNPGRRCREWAAAQSVPLVEKPFLDETLTERIRAAVGQSRRGIAGA